MTRTEENNKALEECSHTISTEAQRTVLLADISKSLAVIADVMSGSQEPTKTSEEAKKLADEAYERIMRGLPGVGGQHMSKNKDIETLHRITGEPYRVCRAKMKANGWDLRSALGFPILATVREVADELVECLRPLLDAICETVKSIDWDGLIETALELKRLQDEGLIQCTAEHCTEDGCENCAGYEPIGGTS